MSSGKEKLSVTREWAGWSDIWRCCSQRHKQQPHGTLDSHNVNT